MVPDQGSEAGEQARGKGVEPKFGAGDAIVGEPMVVVRECQSQWGKATVDLDELARLRLVEKWPIARLQANFGLCGTTIESKLRQIRGAKGIS